jgi:hypothetical protein
MRRSTGVSDAWPLRQLGGVGISADCQHPAKNAGFLVNNAFPASSSAPFETEQVRPVPLQPEIEISVPSVDSHV